MRIVEKVKNDAMQLYLKMGGDHDMADARA
jgi:hypothetical protein